MFAWVKKWAVGCAADYVKSYATVDQLTNLLTDTVDTVLVKVLAKTDAEKLAGICKTCKGVADICSKIAAAIEDGKITSEEANDIINGIYAVSKTSPITDEVLAGYVDQLAEKVKAGI